MLPACDLLWYPFPSVLIHSHSRPPSIACDSFQRSDPRDPVSRDLLHPHSRRRGQHHIDTAEPVQAVRGPEYAVRAQSIGRDTQHPLQVSSDNPHTPPPLSPSLSLLPHRFLSLSFALSFFSKLIEVGGRLRRMLGSAFDRLEPKINQTLRSMEKSQVRSWPSFLSLLPPSLPFLLSLPSFLSLCAACKNSTQWHRCDALLSRTAATSSSHFGSSRTL